MILADKIISLHRKAGWSQEELAGQLEVSAEDTPIRRVTMEEASEYLALSRKIAPKEGLATFLCVISPITLILLGVALFQSCAAKVREYDFLEKEAFETEYGVSGMVKERKKEYKERYTRRNMIGTLLCICSVLPLFVAASLSAEDIAYYQEMAKSLYVSEGSPLTYDDALRVLVQRYLNGAFDAETFAKECQNHVEMIYAEIGE